MPGAAVSLGLQRKVFRILMENDSAIPPSSRWPRRLTILALAFLLAGGVFFAIGWLGFEWTERRARAHPENFAKVVGNGTTALEGPSSWTVVYRGPNARQILADMLESRLQSPITLIIEPEIEGEASEIQSPRHDRRTSDQEAAIAWVHLGRGTHRVEIQLVDDHGTHDAATITFERWRRHSEFWPLVLIVFGALPCWLLSCVTGIAAGVWKLVTRARGRQHHTT